MSTHPKTAAKGRVRLGPGKVELSARQAEIMALVDQGMAVSQIARTLGIRRTSTVHHMISFAKGRLELQGLMAERKRTPRLTTLVKARHPGETYFATRPTGGLGVRCETYGNLEKVER